MSILAKLFKKVQPLKKPAISIYPLIIIVTIPLLLALNTIWNLRSFNRDANFFVRSQAVSTADTLKPFIKEKIHSETELNSLFISTINSNDEIISITLLLKRLNDFEIIGSTNMAGAREAQELELNQLALGFSQPFAALTYDANLQKNVWNVVVPLDIESDNFYLLSLKLKTDTVNEILARTSRDSFIILGILIVVTIMLLANHFVFYRRSLRTQQLEELDKLKDEFISMAAHELRTPMTGLVGYLDLLRDKISPKQMPSFKGDFDTLDTLTKDLNNLINDLLDVSRLEQGRLKVNITSVAINDVIHLVLTTMKPTADKKNLKIIFTPKTLPIIRTDPDRIHQVLGNLVTNAIKYTLKGEVSVSAYEKNKFITVEVKDTGIGIPAEELVQLFTKFHRVKDEKTKEVRGTGLGLWITKQIVEMLGGKIHAESIYGTGTRIIFTLPIHSSAR
jgi:signal transduction histidine kinase